MTDYEVVIGLEVHAELCTRSKMFCGCRVVDSTQAEPNEAVCPVCLGMPGALPVINRQAVDYALRVALALDSKIQQTSIFARKNYFYPDLPKGYQISQYEYPLALGGRLPITTSKGEREIRIRRIHLEEDTGKLTHVAAVPAGGAQSAPISEGSIQSTQTHTPAEGYSLVDLNRAGVPLLEIVSEPDLHSIEEARAYAEGLRSVLRSLGVNSGDMEKGVIRFEANVSVRPAGSQELGTRVEIKNLNSFRTMERAITYQVDQQIHLLETGQAVLQETLGWDEEREMTYPQRGKEEAHDYRYFPEPDLPPLVVSAEWVTTLGTQIPELPYARSKRFQQVYGLSAVDARTLAEEREVSDYYEAAVRSAATAPPRMIGNWITGELFGWLNQSGKAFRDVLVQPEALAGLLNLTKQEINLNTAKTVLIEMLETGKPAAQIIRERGLEQVSDTELIAGLVDQVLQDNPRELESFRAGKETLSNWFFGQVMRAARGRANPQVLRTELERRLIEIKTGGSFENLP